MPEWKIIEGLTPYKAALDIMNEHVSDLESGKANETVILLQHEDVYTAGTGYKAEELLNSSGIDVHYTGRGGKFTYHGPGQRVIYPVLNLSAANRVRDVKKYVKDLEEWMILTLGDFGIEAFIAKDRVGIWVFDEGAEKKIGAIGVRIKKWITSHGIAVNISTDLAKFQNIVPCGLGNYGVTSMKELGVNITFAEFDKALKKNFDKVWD